jgi:hypothetical protein
MGLVSKAEAKVLKGISLIRYRRAKDGNKGALYWQRNCKAEIRVYNRAFESDRWQFVGSPYQPYPSSTRTVLHEVGHAIHNRPSREAFCKYERQSNELKARIATYNAATRKANRTRNRKAIQRLSMEAKRIQKTKRDVTALGHRAVRLAERGPVIAAYAKVIGSRSAPTAYGRTSIRESFAESFSLYRADPSALRRLLPRVSKWFHRGGHLKAMSQK